MAQPPENETLCLVEPSADFKDAFCDMAEEALSEGDLRFFGALSDFEAYLRQCEIDARGVGLPAGKVPSIQYWLIRNNREVLATSNLRLRLTPALLKEGGHIGYQVRLSERRKGYGTRLLALMLEKARERGFDRVLITCDTDNIASGKIIRANGGVFENEVVSDVSGKPVSRYWIILDGSADGKHPHD